MNKFPVTAAIEHERGREIVVVAFPGGELRLCCHGARELARLLVSAAEAGHCDGYRHGDESTMFETFALVESS